MKLIKIYLLSLAIAFTTNAYAQEDTSQAASAQNQQPSSQEASLEDQLIDPTVRPAGTSDPMLKAIAISKNGNFCIIDDRDNLHLLQVNDTFKNFKVLEITKEYVLISNSENTQIKLSFY